MRKNYLKTYSILIAATMATSLSACSSGSNSDSTAAEDGDVTLEFYIWSDEEPYMTEVVDTYNEMTDGVTVDLISIANEDYDDKMKVMLSANSDADIVDVRSLGQLTQYKDAGVLLDLSSYISESNFDISPYGPAWDQTFTDGFISALPTRTTCWMLFYNKDIFDEAGITMPEQLTWEEYAELTKELTKEDKSQYGGFYCDWEMFDALANQNGTYLNDDDISDVQASLEFINRLYNVDESHVPLNQVQGAADTLYLADFENGVTATVINGEWMISMLQADIDEGKTDVNWGIAPMPISEGMEPGTTWGGFQYAGITSSCEHPQEAYDFLEYLCSEGAVDIFPKYSIIPAYSSEESIDALNEAIGVDGAGEIIANAIKMPEEPPYENYGELSTVFNENATLYLIGEKDIDETMENFEEQREKIMSR